MRKSASFKFIALIFTLIFAVSMLSACGASNENTPDPTTAEPTTAESTPSASTPEPEAKLEGTITIVGSTSVQPLAEALADEFGTANPGVKIDVQGGGSTTGVKAANDGTGDIGNSSRDLKDEEKAWGLTEHVIALDGIAVAVNPSNAVQDLTKDQLIKIFTGEIVNWKEVGGADKEILIVSREAGSGTRGAFEEILKIEDKVKSDALVAEGTGAVMANVASKDNAIGYISLGSMDKTVKGLKIDGVEPTVENIKAKTYIIARPFLMLTKGDLKPEVKAFIDFIMSDKGQETVVSQKFISSK
ncbi:phosphate ABC transporter substrate-binding protein (PhoT family) [Anaerobacterium chartisolvens]|uniref:Phosphate-binding protein n=1 Tax=Anaerobacterium chartisolvens TaxID=1297424 RepID=A0A369B7P8_9FIRM|nr:phosphate ABC transporter substrate-binding protein [Anaerobacterium chartisolvens]RCX17540.1 phosphate ABC transporter substrate-binding protein (PhoT family) [Anaerobacterium chartisolvens]